MRAHRRRRKKWKDVAEKGLKLFGSEETRLGGFKPAKDKAEIAEKLSHEDFGRIADVFRGRRLDAESELRKQTEKLIKQRAKLRNRPCSVEVDDGSCGALACDVHHPQPVVVLGIAREFVGRTYAFLAMKELWMRLPALLPLRPSEYTRLRIGRHLDPDSLDFNALRYKNPRNGNGTQRREAHLPSLEPIEGMDPEATDKMVEVLHVCIRLAQPYLASNPTQRGRRLKAKIPHNDEHLFLTYDGAATCDTKGLANMIARMLEDGARSVNAALEEDEDPIRLPSGWGARGAQVFRFLWGHRAVKEGASMSSVALALGNSERTTREYYQKVRSDTAVNAVAETTKNSNAGSSQGRDPERGSSNPASSDYQERLDLLCSRFEKGLLDRPEFDEQKEALKREFGRA